MLSHFTSILWGYSKKEVHTVLIKQNHVGLIVLDMFEIHVRKIDTLNSK